MRDIDENNMEHDKIEELRKDFTNKLAELVERLNVKISSLESRLKQDEAGTKAQKPAPKAPEQPRMTQFYSWYGLGAQVFWSGQGWTVMEITFDKQGALYTLRSNTGSMETKIVSEEALLGAKPKFNWISVTAQNYYQSRPDSYGPLA